MFTLKLTLKTIVKKRNPAKYIKKIGYKNKEKTWKTEEEFSKKKRQTKETY